MLENKRRDKNSITAIKFIMISLDDSLCHLSCFLQDCQASGKVFCFLIKKPNSSGKIFFQKYQFYVSESITLIILIILPILSKA